MITKSIQLIFDSCNYILSNLNSVISCPYKNYLLILLIIQVSLLLYIISRVTITTVTSEANPKFLYSRKGELGKKSSKLF